MKTFKEFLNESKDSDSISKLDQVIMQSNNMKAENEWEKYTDKILPEDNPYWSNVGKNDVMHAIRTAEEIISRYKLS